MSQRVAVVGGGLAGLAAAVALVERGFRVELFEARRRLGGRATSFRDPQSGETIDHCQHVSMGCCTNLADFCRRVGVRDRFRVDDTLHFFSETGARFDFAGKRGMPAPLHLAPGLMGLGYLSLGERIGIGRALLSLARTELPPEFDEPTIGAWLRAQGQSENAIERFWSVVLVSALSEEVDRAGLRYARKVFVDGFMSHRDGYLVEVPSAALDEIYGQPLFDWFAARGAKLRLSTPVAEIAANGETATLTKRDGAQERFDVAIVAVPWRRAAELLAPISDCAEIVAGVNRLQPAPITGVHLWFDREITPLPHAVLTGRLSQWLFRRALAAGEPAGEAYYQVVISASRALATESREQIIEQVVDDLRAVFPEARDANLLRGRVVTEHEAVFSPVPGVDRLRPAARTPVKNLFLAGDWIQTGWPATMEGAVRGGYLAAEAVLSAANRPARVVADNLPRSAIAKILIR